MTLPRGSHFLIAWCVLLAVPALLCAQFRLNGYQQGEFAAGEYVVDSLLVVDSGATVIFQPGVVLRFRPWARMVVRGSLLCRGTRDKPVVFTSYFDRTPPVGKAPAPFDWVAISIEPPADSVYFSHVRLAWSTNGLVVRAPGAKVVVDTMYATGNGTADITAGSETIMAIGARPIVWRSVERGLAPTPVQLVTTSGAPPRTAPRWRKPVLIAATLAAVGGGAAYGIAEYQFRNRYAAYLDTTRTATPEDADAALRSLRTLSVVRGVGIAAASAGAIGIVVTLPLRGR